MRFIAVFLLVLSVLEADSSLYKSHGAHVLADATTFSVFAPHAKKVVLVLNSSKKYPLLPSTTGTWHVEVKKVKPGASYTYLIYDQEGTAREKLDPFACKIAERKKGKFHAVVSNVFNYCWTDSEWMEKRHNDGPISIYEMHVAAWKKDLCYKKLAKELALYCKMMGFTHVELFGLLDHLSRDSWGYRPTSYFAANHRIEGNFQDFVNHMHSEGIGVIVDWIPGHFSSNALGLQDFDGTPLYEYSDHRRAWGSTLFDYTKQSTQDFLMSSIYFWLQEMHVDGIRLDSLDTIVERSDTPLVVKQFMQKMNASVHKDFPGVLMIAESWKGVEITSKEGFGFDYKWNGATNKIVKFLQGEGSFSDVIKPLSQDQQGRLIWHTDHDKSRKETGSLYQQMKGTSLEKLSRMRLMMSYFMTLVGKKMLFMGDELAQVEDWDTRLSTKSSVQWQMQEEPGHLGVQQMIKRLNHLYKTEIDLYSDSSIKLLHVDKENQVVLYRRGSLFFVCNFGSKTFQEYKLAFSTKAKSLDELFSSDDARFGGSGMINPEVKLDTKGRGAISLPALSCSIFIRR